MKKGSLLLVLLLTFFIILFNSNAYSKSLGNEFKVSHQNVIELYSRKNLKPNGEFIISIIKGKKWVEVSRIPCDKFSRDNSVEIKGINKKQKTVKIKITKKGGGAAYIDSIFLNGKAPLPVKTAKDPFLRKKLSKKDLDVTGAHNKDFYLEFPVSGKSGNILEITGRIEAELISKIPFEFPVINNYNETNHIVDFYTYRLGSNKRSMKVDGKINETAGMKPLFKELSVPGSGHPTGYTYCWISNDKDNLYVSVDFTPDNTYDGSLDYSKVIIKTGNSLKEFKVSVPEQRWGKPAFTYTDKVGYQHKTYEFKIPLKEIGKIKGDIQLSVQAYGTAAPSGNTDPAIAYDSVNNRFLLVYQNTTGGVKDICGRFVNPDGTLSGSEIKITDTAQTDSLPDVAYDPVNKRFLVVWQYVSGNNDISGQLVNSDGSLHGENIVISNNSAIESTPKVCYDGANNRFVVIFYDSRGAAGSIYGQIVNSDGTLFGTASNVNFVISDTGNNLVNPLVAFDRTNGRFLAAWNDDRNGNYDVYGQVMNADGSPFGTATNVNFPIANEGNHQIDPSIAFDRTNNRYLLAWTDFRNQGTQSFDIYGQIVNADGSLFNTASNVNFVISNNNGGQTSSMASYSRAVERYIVSWQDTRGGLYGQYLQTDGTAVGTATDVNFSVVNGSIAESVIQCNDSFGNFLIAREDQSNPSSIHLLILGAENPPDIDVAPINHNYGHIAVNANSDPLTVTVTNNGTGPLFVDNLVKSGLNPDQFTIQNDNVSGQRIDPAGNATFQVVFSPTSEGGKYCDITIPSNDPDSSRFVLQVFGNLPYPEPVTSPTTSPTPTPTVSPTSSPTPTPTVSPTTTPTPTPSPTSTPTVPQLVSPENGSTTRSTDVNFQWNSSEDKGKGTISYQIYLGTKPDLSDAEVIDVPTTTTALPFQMAGFTVVFAGIILGAGRKRKDVKFYLLLIALGAMFVTFMVAGCGGSDGDSGGGDPGTTTVSHTVEGLNPATTYYWKIVSTNDRGASTSSDVWNFNTP